jgi:hypothetical protein
MTPIRDRIHRQFRHIGARARLRYRADSKPIAIDVRRDERGEYFEVRLPKSASAVVLSTNQARQHLLLLVSAHGAQTRYVCAQARRRWTVSPVPDRK